MALDTDVIGLGNISGVARSPVTAGHALVGFDLDPDHSYDHRN